jgi:hypothetical protein
MADLDLDELRAELAEFAPAEKKVGRSVREERIIAGFEDILRFVDTHGRAPQSGEDRDIFERLYAVRLERIRAQADCRELVAPLDRHGLLGVPAGGVDEEPADFISDEDLLAELRGDEPHEGDITDLRHVRPREEIKAAEEIANRKPCAEFAAFRPIFDTVRQELKTGVRESRPFGENAAIRQGEFFILGGQLAYVASVPQEYTTEHGHAQGRLRVIFDNGTESDPLLRSFQRALYKDEAGGRRITDPSAGPLFGHAADDEDLESGTIYVLRSKSDEPYVAAHRDLIHKIGVTGGSVEARIAHAAKDATYLLADVEIVATYKLFNINRTRLENVLHRVFTPARLDLAITDRFGTPVQPREWYLVPFQVIDEAVEKVRDGSITDFTYDPANAALVRIAAPN